MPRFAPPLGQPIRPITWDIRLQENEITVRADLDRQGEMRDVDFRKVRSRLNEVLLSESIRLLNRPQDLLNIASANDLCLDQYLHPITQGQYALYQVRHQGEFAVAGLRRSENAPVKSKRGLQALRFPQPG